MHHRNVKKSARILPEFPVNVSNRLAEKPIAGKTAIYKPATKGFISIIDESPRKKVGFTPLYFSGRLGKPF